MKFILFLACSMINLDHEQDHSEVLSNKIQKRGGFSCERSDWVWLTEIKKVFGCLFNPEYISLIYYDF